MAETTQHPFLPFSQYPQPEFTQELLAITDKLKAALTSGDWTVATAYAAQLADWTKYGKRRFQ